MFLSHRASLACPPFFILVEDRGKFPAGFPRPEIGAKESLEPDSKPSLLPPETIGSLHNPHSGSH